MAGVYLPSSLSRQGTDEDKVSVRSVQPWRERTHPHKDLHLLPKSAVSMETKSPAYGMGEPLAPLPLSSFMPLSHFPALPFPSCTSAFPGVPPIHAPRLLPPHPSSGCLVIRTQWGSCCASPGPLTWSAVAQLPGSPRILLNPSANV